MPAVGEPPLFEPPLFAPPLLAPPLFVPPAVEAPEIAPPSLAPPEALPAPLVPPLDVPPLGSELFGAAGLHETKPIKAASRMARERSNIRSLVLAQDERGYQCRASTSTFEPYC
jgi:hypothetical protein